MVSEKTDLEPGALGTVRPETRELIELIEGQFGAVAVYLHEHREGRIPLDEALALSLIAVCKLFR
jgi:hypothetical protein